MEDTDDEEMKDDNEDEEMGEEEGDEQEIRFSVTGQPILSPEEIREQREAELYYRRMKQQQQQGGY